MAISIPATPANDPARAGEIAATGTMFADRATGVRNRFYVAPVHSRLVCGEDTGVGWFVWDANQPHPDFGWDRSAVIGVYRTFEEAVASIAAEAIVA
jgi:hypothetical protein